MTEVEELKAIIAEEAQDWANGFISARVAFLSNRGITRSGVLSNSLASEINRQARQEAVELLVAFEEHGRWIDMRQTAQDKWGRPAVERMRQWVAKVGLDKFERGFIRKYGSRPKLDQAFINKIAWGILINRTYGKYRRRRWWNKSKTAGITELFNEVAAKLPLKVAQQVTQTLKPNGNP